jgi:3-isopropylmalate/(R)-2-methylmalate dehydratase small subunit
MSPAVEPITGRAWVFGDSLNTDAMYPAHAMKLDLAEAAKHVFYQVRPGWTDLVQPGDIVVAGKNFGVGSSRPVANLFQHLGVAALIAEEFNSLFLRNAINAGLPALTVPGATTFFSDGDTATLDVTTGRYANESTGVEERTAPLPDLVLDIIGNGGVLPMLARAGYLPEAVAGLLLSGAVTISATSAA